MKRIGILTAGGDTPALNATIYGAVQRANRLGVEVFGIVRGFAGLLDSRVPHIFLNPLNSTIPELDPYLGGTILGASRQYIHSDRQDEIKEAAKSVKSLGIEGLLCIGGDGTINGMQPVSEHIPCVLAPKTIDNDLGLNYLDEPNEWSLQEQEEIQEPFCWRRSSRENVELEEIINYATPGFATAVFVVAQSIQRIRTTAESHRRIAIVEVMGRQSGYIALGSAYGQPDIILIPEVPLDVDALKRRVVQLFELQEHVVIVIGEGVMDMECRPLGAVSESADPEGNIVFRGAALALKDILMAEMGDEYFCNRRGHGSAKSAIFTRKVGHSQRGGRPILFDRFHAAQLGGHALELLVSHQNNYLATLQWSREKGIYLDSFPANKLRDRNNVIHPRRVHHAFFDEKLFQPSKLGRQYLKTIFDSAIGAEDLEHIHTDLFNSSHLDTRYQSVNIDMRKRIQYLEH